MFAVCKSGCVGSAGLGLCVCLELSIFIKKHQPVHKATLSCSKVMTQCFSQVSGVGRGVLESGGLAL